MRISLRLTLNPGNGYDCHTCEEHRRQQFNCHNRQRLRHVLLQGADEWRLVPTTLKHVVKIDDLKFFECPGSVITRSTWQILDLLNECLDENGSIKHLLPGPGDEPGHIFNQPGWFRTAAKLVRIERNSDWFARERDAAVKKRSSSGR